MMKRICHISLILLLCLIAHSNAYAQNNLPQTLFEYYNLKDTSLARKMAEITIPMLEIKNTAVLDTLRDYASEAILNRYGQHEDSNGIYFLVDFSNLPDDSTAMYILIFAGMNYYMHSHLITTRNSGLEPPSHKKDIVGGAWYGPYLVIFSAKRYIPTAEISRFLSETGDSIHLHIYEERPQRAIHDYPRSRLFSVPFSNINSYVSPVWPRRR